MSSSNHPQVLTSPQDESDDVHVGTAMTAGEVESWLDKQPGLSVVMFTGPNCPACQRLTPIMNTLGIRHGIRILFVDATASPDACEYFRVQSLPYLLAFRDGRYERTIPAIPGRIAGAILDLAAASKGK
jgi:thioredoxin-like negative regulator of GroEL